MALTQVACHRMCGVELAERTMQGLHAFLLDGVAARVAKDAHVLDVGCGTGAWLSRLRRAGYTHTYGIDLDDAAASVSGIEFQPVDLEHADWRLEGSSFEFITAIEVIEHIGNRTNFLRNLHRQLSPDGLILMTTPNVHNLSSRLRFLLSDNLRHFNEYADRTHYEPIFLYPFQLLARREGFRIVDLESYSPARNFRGSRRPVQYVLEGLSTLLPNQLPGEILLIWLSKDQAR